MKSIISREDNIIFETPTHYVYKMGVGHYEIRKGVNNTHSIVVGVIDVPDEDEDAKTRAIELCKEKLQ
jgi:hypothetical protein